MELNSFLGPLLGGALIGGSATLMLLFNGRVTGISGIISAAATSTAKDGWWRWSFLAGMLVAGAWLSAVRPEFFQNLSDRGGGVIFIAGLLVGYGTLLGSGCTSGHGICGLSRFSARSLIATITFMLFGFLGAQAARLFMGGLV